MGLPRGCCVASRPARAPRRASGDHGRPGGRVWRRQAICRSGDPAVRGAPATNGQHFAYLQAQADQGVGLLAGRTHDADETTFGSSSSGRRPGGGPNDHGERSCGEERCHAVRPAPLPQPHPRATVAPLRPGGNIDDRTPLARRHEPWASPRVSRFSAGEGRPRLPSRFGPRGHVVWWWRLPIPSIVDQESYAPRPQARRVSPCCRLSGVQHHGSIIRPAPDRGTL